MSEREEADAAWDSAIYNARMAGFLEAAVRKIRAIAEKEYTKKDGKKILEICEKALEQANRTPLGKEKE